MGTQIYYFIYHKKTKFTFIKPDNQHVNKQHDKNFLFLKFLQKKNTFTPKVFQLYLSNQKIYEYRNIK